jgi:hypothetical protein
MIGLSVRLTGQKELDPVSDAEEYIRTILGGLGLGSIVCCADTLRFCVFRECGSEFVGK